ncbi:MAG: S-formylglutathione hydrolase [Proteobacteria bacterium]|nr:S-formylglutathione hydrolase [Pseudomonadota bacterium]MBW3617241.1 S-formylglutathione hydrolase [Pseudomonadota bacterium]
MRMIEDHGSFEGRQQVWEHDSRETRTPMRFSVYLPPAAKAGPAPVVWWLSGLTCNEQNFIIKAGAQRYASELGLIIVGPDTSPRGPALDGGEVAGDPDGQGEIGPSAGYYLDATQAPWAPHYRMRSYVEGELPEVVAANFPADMSRQGMCGHSMGGHGALTVSLRNPGRFRATSALAPISAPTKVESGRKRLRAYLGEDEQAWRAYDATCLIEDGGRLPELLVDQGLDDPLMERLRPDLLEAACREHGQSLELRRLAGYGHNYYFVASVIGEHLRWHAERLRP